MIHIDQFNTVVGNFGITSIEALINGNIVLSTYNNVNLDEISVNYSQLDLSNKDMVNCPIIDTSEGLDHFAHQLEDLCKKTDDDLRELSIRSYDYFVKYMSPEIACSFLEKYIFT